MSLSNNFRGCKAFIHDSNGEMLVSNTLIKAYDSDRLIATVDGHPSVLKENERISILILHKSAVYEFQGTVRRMELSGDQELALFKGNEKEDRKAVRYVVNLSATIECLIIGKKLTPLASPEKVLIKNLSQTGILVQMDSKIFSPGAEFQVKIHINGAQTRLNACVKRVNKLESQKFEFGCALTGRS